MLRSPIHDLILAMKSRDIKFILYVAAGVILYLNAHAAGRILGKFWYHVTHF